MSGGRRIFSTADDAEIHRMVRVGGTVRDIAAELGRPRTSVRARLRHLGLEARAERVRDRRQRAAGVADRRDRQAVWQPFSDEERREMLRCRDAGMTVQGIGNRLGRRDASVAAELDRIRTGAVQVPPGKERHRACLRCGDRFWSTGPGHRHCKPCRRALRDESQDDPYSVVGAAAGSQA